MSGPQGPVSPAIQKLSCSVSAILSSGIPKLFHISIDSVSFGIVLFPDNYYSNTKWKVIDFFRLEGWENITINDLRVDERR